MREKEGGARARERIKLICVPMIDKTDDSNQRMSCTANLSGREMLCLRQLGEHSASYHPHSFSVCIPAVH